MIIGSDTKQFLYLSVMTTLISMFSHITNGYSSARKSLSHCHFLCFLVGQYLYQYMVLAKYLD